MKVSTKLGFATVISDQLDTNTNTWRTVYSVGYTLNEAGRKAFDRAADATGGVELVLFEPRQMTITVVISREVDPASTLKLLWKNFRSQIRRCKSLDELTGEFELQKALAVNGEPTNGFTLGTATPND